MDMQRTCVVHLVCGLILCSACADTGSSSVPSEPSDDTLSDDSGEDAGGESGDSSEVSPDSSDSTSSEEDGETESTNWFPEDPAVPCVADDEGFAWQNNLPVGKFQGGFRLFKTVSARDQGGAFVGGFVSDSEQPQNRWVGRVSSEGNLVWEWMDLAI